LLEINRFRSLGTSADGFWSLWIRVLMPAALRMGPPVSNFSSKNQKQPVTGSENKEVLITSILQILTPPLLHSSIFPHHQKKMIING
jgi:hypothetical protein